MSAPANQAYSIVAPSGRAKAVAGSLVIVYALITMIPLVWIVLTSFKTPPDSIAYPPKLVFTPSATTGPTWSPSIRVRRRYTAQSSKWMWECAA